MLFAWISDKTRTPKGDEAQALLLSPLAWRPHNWLTCPLVRNKLQRNHPQQTGEDATKAAKPSVEGAVDVVVDEEAIATRVADRLGAQQARDVAATLSAALKGAVAVGCKKTLAESLRDNANRENVRLKALKCGMQERVFVEGWQRGVSYKRQRHF